MSEKENINFQIRKKLTLFGVIFLLGIVFILLLLFVF